MEYNTVMEVLRKRLVRLSGEESFICDNENYTLTFEFDDEWMEHVTKTVLFILPGGECVPVLTKEDTCKVPVITKPGILYIGVKAGSTLKTTAPFGITVLRSAQTMCGSEAAQIPPDVAQQIIERLDELEVDMEALRKFVEEEGGLKGDDGITPHIGPNGNWFLGEEDTGVKAKGEDGDPGVTPHIGPNGNWFLGDTDTGVKAKGEDGRTPQKGVDYYTEADKEEIAQEAADKIDTSQFTKVQVLKKGESIESVGSDVDVVYDPFSDPNNVVDVPDGGSYRYLKTITTTEEVAEISETFPVGYDGVIVTIENITLASGSLRLYVTAGKNWTLRGVGGDIKTDYVLRFICRKLNGTWDVFGYQGLKSDASTMIGQIAANAVSAVTSGDTPEGFGTSFDVINKIRVYSYHGYSLPVGITVKIFVLGGEENA